MNRCRLKVLVCSRSRQMVRTGCAIVLALSFLVPFATLGGTNARRPVSVADAITMTTLSDERYFLGDSADGRVAQFSPDGKWFTVLLEKGDIEHNTNVYSLLLFETGRAFESPKPIVLLTLASSSSRPAIAAPKWLPDNETLIFLCEKDRETAQVCTLNKGTGRLAQRTRHETRVLSFDASSDGRTIVFLAEPPARVSRSVESSQAVVVTAQAPDLVPRDDCNCPYHDPTEANQLFVQMGDVPERRVEFSDFAFFFQPISVSPDGRYAVLPAAVTNVPGEWSGYTDPVILRSVTEKRSVGIHSSLERYLLLETSTARIRPLINAPLEAVTQGFAWRPDSQSAVVSGAFLPLETVDTVERSVREKASFVVEINVATGAFTKISDRRLEVAKWMYAGGRIVLRSPSDNANVPVVFEKAEGLWKEVPASGLAEYDNLPLMVTLEEDLNTPPDIYVRDWKGNQRTLLLALNPQFSDIEFGTAEPVTWRATDGHEVAGVLFLPPHYRSGVKYPLVIQTHGIDSGRFEMDGPWHSAFAARMLAGRDIVVLEVGHATNSDEAHRYFNSQEEAPREMAAYEGGIDYLDGRGVIDRTRVGIIGFSRTVWKVEFALTHSNYAFAAVILADGFDAGYWQYLLYRAADTDFARVNAGQPFGEGLGQWFARSPSFHVDRVHTPVRIEEHGSDSVAGGWEWFSALTHLERPVELVYLPRAPHLLVKPWDRLASQQGTVDWFCFWLKGEKDADPEKSGQYERWEALRQLQRRADETPENGEEPVTKRVPR